MTCYFYKFSKIKWLLLKDFFFCHAACTRVVNVESLADALAKGISGEDQLFFWGKKIDEALLDRARQTGVKVRFVEDGFIRSLGLGSALSKPLSIVMDAQGIYFDPNAPSDLEDILRHQHFDEVMLNQADVLIDKIRTTKISKYNHLNDEYRLDRAKIATDRVILVPGQVDDDMSVKFGAFGLNNLSLLQQVRALNPTAYILYKPHPDVLSKNRVGDIADDVVLRYANEVVKFASIDAVIACVDEVHTMTSLVGFDSLVRGKQVFTYGMPFYAGWGLTTDYRHLDRRDRQLTLQQLVAGCLITYPCYLNPHQASVSDVFEVIDLIGAEKEALKHNVVKRTTIRVLGFVLPRIRNVMKSIRMRLKLT